MLMVNGLSRRRVSRPGTAGKTAAARRLAILGWGGTWQRVEQGKLTPAARQRRVHAWPWPWNGGLTWRLRDGDGALAPDWPVRTRRAVESGGGDTAILKPDFVGHDDRAMMGGPRMDGIQRINGIDQSIVAGFPSGFAPDGWLDPRHWKWSVERHEELIEWFGGATARQQRGMFPRGLGTNLFS